MKTSLLLLVLCLAALWTGGCDQESDSDSAPEAAQAERVKSGSATSTLEALNRPDIRIGLPQGAAAMTAGEKLFPLAKLLYYNSLAEGYAAVQHGKLDLFLFDRHSMIYVVKNNPQLKLLAEDFAEEHIVIGFPKKHGDLRNKVNEFIRQFRADGTYQDMYQRWCVSGNPPPMPEIPAPENPTATFKVGTEGLNEPMNFYGKDGKLTGFDLEFIQRLALFLNAKLEVSAMTYDALIPAAESGKIDMLIANLNGSPEREEKMLMSDDYVDSAITGVVHANSNFGQTPQDDIQSLRDLKGKRAASLTGSGFQELTDPLQSGIEYLFFNDNNSSVQALRSGKVDAVLLDEPMARMWAARFPAELRFVGIYAEDHYGFAFKKGSPLTARASEIIRMLRQSGELQTLTRKWCDSSEPNRKLEVWTHRKDYTGAAGIFRFGSDPTQEPMCYLDNAQYIGLDMEIMNRIAYELNMKFEFVPMNFGALIEAVNAGKADAVGASMSITEPRKAKVDFADSYYDGGLSILARREEKSKRTEISEFSQLAGCKVGILCGTTFDTLTAKYLPQSLPVYYNMFNDLVIALETEKIDAFLMEEPQSRLLLRHRPNLTTLKGKVEMGGGIVLVIRNQPNSSAAESRFTAYLKKTGHELAASFDRTFVRENRWKLILAGLKVTVLITVLAAILGTLLAFPVCMMRRSKHWLWRTLGRGYISLMQGTPILVILMILYYIVFAKIDIDAVVVAVIGFGLNFSAYVAEMLRTGIDGVLKGQSEAALALGFSRFAVFRKVILPQAVRSTLPVYRGEFINVLKMTSIVGYIAIQDLTKMSDIIRSRTYEAFFPLIATAVIYFAAAWLLASGLSLIEYRLDPDNRRKSRKGGAK